MFIPLTIVPPCPSSVAFPIELSISLVPVIDVNGKDNLRFPSGEDSPSTPILA